MPARLALLALACAGCMGGIVPPSRTELGTTVITGGRPQSGLRFATGAHLASSQTERDGRLDLGVGYVYERLGAPTVGSDSSALGAMDAVPAPVSHQEAHGMYIDAAGVLQRGPWYRSWIGARSELLSQEGTDGPRKVGGTFARVAWETYGPVSTSGSGTDSSGAYSAGFAHGAFALGLFLESGVRYAEGEDPAFVAIGGVTLRMPWMGGFVFDPTPRW
jgi:hypothetical protein